MGRHRGAAALRLRLRGDRHQRCATPPVPYPRLCARRSMMRSVDTSAVSRERASAPGPRRLRARGCACAAGARLPCAALSSERGRTQARPQLPGMDGAAAAAGFFWPGALPQHNAGMQHLLAAGQLPAVGAWAPAAAVQVAGASEECANDAPRKVRASLRALEARRRVAAAAGPAAAGRDARILSSSAGQRAAAARRAARAPWHAPRAEWVAPPPGARECGAPARSVRPLGVKRKCWG